jgi:hypothetical protein
MNRQDAIRVTDEFLEEYTAREEYYDNEAEESRLWKQYVRGGASSGGIEVCFSIRDGERDDDPELLALAQRAMDALFAAHPELKQLQVTHELSA